MSRDSTVTSLPEAGWSCQTLEEGINIAARAAGLSLKTRDYTEAWGVRSHIRQTTIVNKGMSLYIHCPGDKIRCPFSGGQSNCASDAEPIQGYLDASHMQVKFSSINICGYVLFKNANLKDTAIKWDIEDVNFIYINIYDLYT